jgi:hypothetical protein
MDLETLRDVGDPVTDHECQENWLTRSLLLVHNQMRAAPGNLVSDKLLDAMAQPPDVGAAATPKQIPFNNLREHVLSQARTIDAALKMTDKETRCLHESERVDPSRSGGRDPSGQGFGRGREMGSNDLRQTSRSSREAPSIMQPTRQAPDHGPHWRRRQTSLRKNNHSLTECQWMP